MINSLFIFVFISLAFCSALSQIKEIRSFCSSGNPVSGISESRNYMYTGSGDAWSFNIIDLQTGNNIAVLDYIKAGSVYQSFFYACFTEDDSYFVTYGDFNTAQQKEQPQFIFWDFRKESVAKRVLLDDKTQITHSNPKKFFFIDDSTLIVLPITLYFGQVTESKSLYCVNLNNGRLNWEKPSNLSIVDIENDEINRQDRKSVV